MRHTVNIYLSKCTNISSVPVFILIHYSEFSRAERLPMDVGGFAGVRATVLEGDAVQCEDTRPVFLIIHPRMAILLLQHLTIPQPQHFRVWVTCVAHIYIHGERVCVCSWYSFRSWLVLISMRINEHFCRWLWIRVFLKCCKWKCTILTWDSRVCVCFEFDDGSVSNQWCGRWTVRWSPQRLICQTVSSWTQVSIAVCSPGTWGHVLYLQ